MDTRRDACWTKILRSWLWSEPIKDTKDMATGMMKKGIFGVAMVTAVWFVLSVTYLSDLGTTERDHGILRHPREARRTKINTKMSFNFHETTSNNSNIAVQDPMHVKTLDISSRPTPTAPRENLAQSTDNEIDISKTHHTKAPSPKFQTNHGDNIYDKYFVDKTVIERGRSFTRDEFIDLENGMKRHSFNVSASELLPLDRTVPDFRPLECPDITEHSLPSTSVIICFHNEAWSTLLRTLHSVINRTPSQLIKEIFLVDDASTFDYLGLQLENHLAQFKNVYLLRTKSREGLIRARLLGVSYAKGDVLVFLDSHCECSEGWLPPLLYAITKDNTKVVCPLVDVIEYQSFVYKAAKEELHGAFDWNLQFIWKDLPEHEMKRRRSPADNIRTPTMIGGLFAVDRKYFQRIGSYDSGMDIWGGENLELSFRIWMCGGSLEISPCSRVGHVFRTRIPYGFPKGGKRTIVVNAMRVAEVWLQEYKKFFYASQNIARKFSTREAVSDRLELRKKLKCKSFQWYLDKIIPEAVLPGDTDEYFGQIQSLSSPSTCLEFSNKQLSLSPCKAMKETQIFHLTNEQLFQHGEVTCFDINGRDLVTRDCEISRTTWSKAEDNSIEGEDGSEMSCLEANGDSISMEKCLRTNIHQKWKFSHHFNQDKLNMPYK